MSQCNLFQLPQNCKNAVAGHLHQYILFSNDPELYNKKKFTVVRHPCRLTTLPSNTRVSLSWDLTLIPISLGRHPEETRAFLMSARSLEMLRDTSELGDKFHYNVWFWNNLKKKTERDCVLILIPSRQEFKMKKVPLWWKVSRSFNSILNDCGESSGRYMQARKSNPSKCRKGEWVSGWEIWC